MNIQDTIVALATANGAGAIAVIRLSGENAIHIANSVFKSAVNEKALVEKNSHTISLGDVVDGERILDRALFSVFKNPHSYTGENVVEISCHGSVFIQQQVLQLLIKKGARMATAGEFTMRAYLNGKMDLAQAEAVADLIAANSDASHQNAMQQMRGGFSNDLQDLREQLIHFAAMIELELDFSEEDVEFADRSELHELLHKLEKALKYLSDSFSLGNVIKEGIPVAIVGEPNVGKSTLLNALLNEERAIVSDIEGTTRDTIEDELVLDGICYRFIDTAGIRKTADTIESIGIQKTYEKIASSRVVLYMMDAQRLHNKQSEYLEEIQKIAKKYPDKLLIPILNKVDALEKEIPTELQNLSHFIALSAKQKQGVEKLTHLLISLVEKGALTNNDTIVTNSRHYEALTQALDFIRKTQEGLQLQIPGDLLAMDIRQSLHYLGTITGNIDVDEDILGKIFSSFCIGK
ncbi:MAG: tRNA uridine-5-carboxymethylaminomethyl(34) synthesis GTPase MnmE [Flavobacteriales bacterium]|nr:tRNA uridine-5-carboxymethylaminomethyl(34) synthesis GTPase MnmE [Flavobacteriales bacterium]